MRRIQLWLQELRYARSQGETWRQSVMDATFLLLVVTDPKTQAMIRK